MSAKLSLLICAAGLTLTAPAFAQNRDADRPDRPRSEQRDSRPPGPPHNQQPQGAPARPSSGAPSTSAAPAPAPRAWQSPAASPQRLAPQASQQPFLSSQGRPSGEGRQWGGVDRNWGGRADGHWDREDHDRRGDANGGWSYRGEDHERFRVPPYRYPYNWGYRTWRVGERLPYLFLSDGYYIEFGPYGLPRPPYGYRWVRFGPDVLLVNVYTGEIVDVVYDIFY